MIKNIKKNILTLSVISMFSVSCSQTKDIKATVIEDETPTNAATETPAQVPNTEITEIPANGTTVQMQPGTPTNAATAANTQTKPQVAKGMNPAHGEPNHRCDIAVGAPLSSPPGNAQAAPQTMQAPIQTAPVQTTPAAAPANPMNLAVNPAHGEPGHSCAIAVGAPFK